MLTLHDTIHVCNADITMKLYTKLNVLYFIDITTLHCQAIFIHKGKYFALHLCSKKLFIAFPTEFSENSL